jgi:hypothetical protein
VTAMRLAAFCRWPSRDARGESHRPLGARPAEELIAEETGGPAVLGIYFTRAPADGRDATGLLAATSAAETFVGVEIGDTGPCEPGEYVFLVTFHVPRDDQGDFDSWYESEHVPQLMKVPGWLRCRRYAVADHGTSPTRVALHELATLGALDSPLRAAAAASERRRELAERSWFATGKFDTFRRVGVEETP